MSHLQSRSDLTLSHDKPKEEYVKVYDDFTTKYHDAEMPKLLYPASGFYLNLKRIPTRLM